jgi:hypothetical protein
VPSLPSDRPTAPVTTAPLRCTNCGAEVSGNYCSACGQNIQYHLHSPWEFLAEATEVITHADSRLWRTMAALVARPGFLTQQYLAGRRASYIPPFRLYLFFSVVFFLLVSLTDTHSMHPAGPAEATSPPAALSGGPSAIDAPDTAAQTREQFCQAFVGHSKLQSVNRMRQPFLTACIKSQADNGREFRENFVRHLGRAMFLLLPLLAGIMKLMYWRPRRLYVNHLLLLFHNHAFVFLLMASVLAGLHWIHADFGVGWLTAALIGYLAYYLYQSMHRVYAESWQRTLIKFAALSVVYVACAVCTVTITGLYSAVTL